MEEKKQEILEEQEQKETEQENEKKQSPTRRFVWWMLAGAYLVYTGYKLCKDVLAGAEGAGTGFFIAGIIFLAAGAVLFIFGSKELWKQDKAKRAEQAAARRMNTEIAGETSEEAEKAPEENAEASAKPMSIAERARLASRLQEEGAGEEEAREEEDGAGEEEAREEEAQEEPREE